MWCGCDGRVCLAVECVGCDVRLCVLCVCYKSVRMGWGTCECGLCVSVCVAYVVRVVGECVVYCANVCDVVCKCVGVLWM